MTEPSQISRAYSRIYESVGFLAGAIVAVVTVLTFYEVVARYIINRPTDWSLELTGFVYVYGGLGAIAFATYKRAHIRVDVVYLCLPRGLQRIIDAVGIILFLAFLAILTVYGIEALRDSVRFNQHHYGNLGWHLATTLPAVPAVAVLAALPLLVELYEIVTGRGSRAESDRG